LNVTDRRKAISGVTAPRLLMILETVLRDTFNMPDRAEMLRLSGSR